MNRGGLLAAFLIVATVALVVIWHPVAGSRGSCICRRWRLGWFFINSGSGRDKPGQ